MQGECKGRTGKQAEGQEERKGREWGENGRAGSREGQEKTGETTGRRAGVQGANEKAGKGGHVKPPFFAINLQDKIFCRRRDADKFHNYSRRLECRLAPLNLYVELDNFLVLLFSVSVTLRQAPIYAWRGDLLKN